MEGVASAGGDRDGPRSNDCTGGSPHYRLPVAISANGGELRDRLERRVLQLA